MLHFTQRRFRTVSTVAVPLLVLSLAVLFAPVRAAAQAPASATNAAAKSKSGGTAQYKAPRLPDGKPDFTGYWTNQTATPLERPDSFKGREFLTPAEVAEI